MCCRWCKITQIFLDYSHQVLHSFKIRLQRSGLRRAPKPGVWWLPPTSALSQQGLLANPSPSLNRAKVLILLSQRCAKMSRADVPDFKLRSSQLSPATTHSGNLTLSPGKRLQKLSNHDGKKRTPEYQGHLDGDKGMRTWFFLCRDAYKYVQTVIIPHSYQSGQVCRPNTCPCCSREVSRACFPEHDHPFNTPLYITPKKADWLISSPTSTQ